MAHSFARELNVSPWDALLKAVRIAAGKVAYCELVLSRAGSDLEIEGRRPRELTEERTAHVPTRDGPVEVTRHVGTGVFVHPDTGEPLGAGKMRDLTFWRRQSELWVDRMARYSKMAVDAGVAAALVQRVELEAQAIAQVINAMLEGIQDTADEATIARARSIAREQLLLLDESSRVVRMSADADLGVVDSTWQEKR